jgi:hypothetical protein
MKRSFRKDFIIISFQKKIGLKMNYLKRQGYASCATGPAHWEKIGYGTGSVQEEETR